MFSIILALQKSTPIVEGGYVINGKGDNTEAIQGSGLKAYQYVPVCSEAADNTSFGVCDTKYTIYNATYSGFYSTDDIEDNITYGTADVILASDLSGAVLVDNSKGVLTYILAPTKVGKGVETEELGVYDVATHDDESNDGNSNIFALVTMILFYVAFAMIITIFVMMVFDLSKCCACNCCSPKLKSIFAGRTHA